MSVKQYMSRDCSQGLSVSNAAHTERICLSYSLYLLAIDILVLAVAFSKSSGHHCSAYLQHACCSHSGLLKAEGIEIYRLRLQALNPEFCYQIAAASAC